VTIYYVTDGPWGTGTGVVHTAARADGIVYDLDQRIVGLTGDLAEGKRIESVSYTDTSITFTYTDSTSDTIPLPVLTLQYVGAWTPSTIYVRGNLFTDTATHGFYQVLQDHTSAATFDPNATLGGNPLYALWMPLYDTLESLTDVDVSAAASGDILVFNGTAWTSETPTPPTTPALDDLSDVNLGTLTTGQVLAWQGTFWENSNPITTIEGLSDISIVSPAEGQVLAYTGTSGLWANTDIILPLANLSDVQLGTLYPNQPLIYNAATSKWGNLGAADMLLNPIGSQSGIFNLDMTGFEFNSVSMIGNCSPTFTWPNRPGQFVRRALEITNTGAFTWFWPGGIKWPGGVVPTITYNGTDVFVFFTHDGGTTVYGNTVGQGYTV